MSLPVSFNAIHAAPGAFFSLTCGHHGTPQGLALQRGSPANQSLYVGLLPAGYEQPVFLPFHAEETRDQELAYDVDRAQNGPKAGLAGLKDIKRSYKYATDAFCASVPDSADLQFTIATPFYPIPDPDDPASSIEQAMLATAPVVVAELRIRNNDKHGVCRGIFGLGFKDEEQGLADLADAELGKEVKGFAMRGQLGYAARVKGGGSVFPVQAFGMSKLHKKEVGLERLGNAGVLTFDVGPGEEEILEIVCAGFLEGTVTTRHKGRYWYTRYFPSLASVLTLGFKQHTMRFDKAYDMSVEFEAQVSSLSKQFLAAHAVRSYFGSSQLLEVGGQPYYIVNEGGYVMMNTLDLSIDHVFFELTWSPWLVRNILDNFLQFYSYTDKVRDPSTGDEYPGGISFTHDQGFHNQFSPRGYSSYERANYTGCFSYMTQEQLCNWVLLAGTYFAWTRDVAWLTKRAPILVACLTSMENRDHPEEQKRSGIMSFDSSRCEGGQEITTYDSLDPSLKQARANLYLTVKSWATYLSLALCFEVLHDSKNYENSFTAATRVASAVCARMGPEEWIPAVFETDSPGFHSRILPAAEGLVYPLFWKTSGLEVCDGWLAKENGPFSDMLSSLRKHTSTLLAEGTNVFPDGGIKLSSTSNGSWMSKIAIFQHVASQLWGMEVKESDAAHVQWQLDPSAAESAMCDQISAGKAVGSLYYPRCVTNHLPFIRRD